MKCETIFELRGNTIGVARITEQATMHKVPGYFNKELLKEALTTYLDMFADTDVSIAFQQLEDSAMLAIFPANKKEFAIVVCGKTDVGVYE